MIAAVRECGSLAELDQSAERCRRDFARHLNCFEDGAVEEDILSAFNIALDQFHNGKLPQIKPWHIDGAVRPGSDDS